MADVASGLPSLPSGTVRGSYFRCMDFRVIAASFFQNFKRLRPFIGSDTHEMGYLPLFQEGDTLAHACIEDDAAWVICVQIARRIQCRHNRVQVVAVDPLTMPAECLPLRFQRLGTEHLRGMAIGLLVVEIHQTDQVTQLVMSGGHRRFPRRSLAKFTVRHQVVDEGIRPFAFQAQSHANGNTQPVTQRATRDLHARCVGRHAGHWHPAVVHAVGVEFVFREDTGLHQRRVERDGVMADGKQKPVPSFPFRITGPVAERVEVARGQHIGDAERLSDVALPLHFAHQEGLAPDIPGAKVERDVCARSWHRICSQCPSPLPRFRADNSTICFLRKAGEEDMPKYRSHRTTQGKQQAAARALWRATGTTEEDMAKPIVAVSNSFTQFVPGHVHLKDLGQLVAAEIHKAGAVAKEFNTIAVDDGIAMGHEGMLYSLPSRELIADGVEYMVNAHCADALVCISTQTRSHQEC